MQSLSFNHSFFHLWTHLINKYLYTAQLSDLVLTSGSKRRTKQLCSLASQSWETDTERRDKHRIIMQVSKQVGKQYKGKDQEAIKEKYGKLR